MSSSNHDDNLDMKYWMIVLVGMTVILFLKYHDVGKINSNNRETTNFIIVHVTVPSKTAGEKIANVLLNNKLAACVNIIPGVSSFYTWKNKINEDAELLLEIKTKSRLFNSLEEIVIKNHPYDVPEVIAFPMQFVSKSYGAWIEENTL